MMVNEGIIVDTNMITYFATQKNMTDEKAAKIAQVNGTTIDKNCFDTRLGN